MSERKQIMNLREADEKHSLDQKNSSSSQNDAYQRLREDRQRTDQVVFKVRGLLNTNLGKRNNNTLENTLKILKDASKELNETYTISKKTDRNINDDMKIYDHIKNARDILISSGSTEKMIDYARDLNEILPSNDKKYIASQDNVKNATKVIGKLKTINDTIRLLFKDKKDTELSNVYINIFNGINDIKCMIDQNKHLGKEKAIELAEPDLSAVIKLFESTGSKSQKINDLKSIMDSANLTYDPKQVLNSDTTLIALADREKDLIEAETPKWNSRFEYNEHQKRQNAIDQDHSSS